MRKELYAHGPMIGQRRVVQGGSGPTPQSAKNSGGIRVGPRLTKNTQGKGAGMLKGSVVTMVLQLRCGRRVAGQRWRTRLDD